MATLTDSITAIADRLSITDPGSPRPGARYEIDDELVELVRLAKVRPGVDNDPTDWYVNRGVEGTVATSHAGGTTVTEFVVTAGGGLPTGWTQDEADPATLSSNGGALDLGGGALDMGSGGFSTSGDVTMDGGTINGPGAIYAGAGGITITDGDLWFSGTGGVNLDGGSIDLSGGELQNAASVGEVIVAAAPPAGAPANGKLPFAYDTTAVSGGFYFWDGAAWVKVATIL